MKYRLAWGIQGVCSLISIMVSNQIITLAKGLASEFPIGAMMGKKELREAFSAGSHGSTFGEVFLR